MSSQRIDEYWNLVSLWKFYLDLIIKVNVFFAALTSGVLVYVLDCSSNFEVIRFTLLPVILFALGFLAITSIGINQSSELSTSMDEIAYEIGTKQPVHSVLLVRGMTLTAGFYAVASLGLIYLFFFGTDLVGPCN
ncbi:hypothetical protein IWQ48_003783 [Labrenzia sp. EL_13]|nr:hypothetical protein [Labrenzia sp. EL_13]